jgi:hypothetical protein
VHRRPVGSILDNVNFVGRVTFIKRKNRPLVLIFLIAIALSDDVGLRGNPVILANPSNYLELLRNLKPGDTLNLVAGDYPTLPITDLNGNPDAWITITGPASGPPAVIVGSRKTGVSTVEILNSSYVAIENLRIDSLGVPGCFGISARGHEDNMTHHIRIEGNTLVGQGGGQQTDGISTKTPTWGWIIRYNQILGAGTGLYLGDSDGSQPFVNGVIENNLVKDTIGYNMEIKDQIEIPAIPGMPSEPTSTIIRNNVFIKDDRPSPDGDRPNVLVGAFPTNGTGALNTYEIYGNWFLHNHREALFQGSGRFSLHDNIFVDGPYTYPAIVLRNHNFPLKVALVYNNTIYTSGKGIYFGTKAEIYDAVIGNLVFSPVPISGSIMQRSNNIVDLVAKAGSYVKSPAFAGAMDYYPLHGQCQGPPLDLSDFHSDTDYTVDFNRTLKTSSKSMVVYRGAYAGEGPNPGWVFRTDGVKAPVPPRAKPAVTLVWLDPASGPAGSTVQVTLTGAGFTPESQVEVSGPGVEVVHIKVEDTTRIAATLKTAAGTPSGVHEVTVRSPGGSSNTAKFQIRSGRPKG